MSSVYNVKGYQHIDNFLPDDIFNNIQSLLMSHNSMQMPYFYRKGLTTDDDTEGFAFGNCLMNEEQIPDINLFNEIALPIVSRLPMKRLLRVKVNCYPRQTLRNSKQYPPSEFHSDFDFPHTTGILSINDCNGYTEFTNEHHFLTKSEANKMILFAGEEQHRSVGQSDTNLRVNININFI
tara:strand:+ start:2530 stop:3069 length:540 start_codon:yes stop_codon:yes gene_type:complete